MRRARLSGAGLVVGLVLLLVPAWAFAQYVGIPIGGLVKAEAPCPSGAGFLYTVVGYGIGSGVFWYFPGVFTYPFGPPVIGSYVLGLAEPVGTCGATTLFEGTGAPLGTGASTGAGAALNGHGLY